MKRARSTAGWLKQKSKLLTLLIVALGASFGSALIPMTAHASPADATWKDNYQTLSYNGDDYTGPNDGPTAGKVYFTPGPLLSPKYCTKIIVFDTANYKTETTAHIYTGTKIGQVCNGYSVGNSITVDTTAGPAGGSGSDSGGQVATEDPCDMTADPLSWFICPIINMISGAVSKMQSIIDNLLEFDVATVFDRNKESGQAYYTAWNSFRLVGIAVVVIAGLVMVITQALGLEVFDAYTVKKMVPRLFLAAIGISLSWYLLQFLANVTNDLGLAVRNMIYWPFRNIGDGDTGLTGAGGLLAGDLVAGGVFLALGLAGTLSLVVSAGLAALVAFLVLILRQMVLILLIILAPLAIALYVLPNTQKIYQLWWDSISKGFMMFPIIVAFIATGRVFSVVAANAGGNGVHGVVNEVVSLIAFFLPYFALPFTFRLAGGAIGTLAGLTNDRSRGAFDRLKNFRGQKTAANLQAMRNGNRFQSSNVAARAFNKTSGTIAAIPSAGANPLKMKQRMQSAMSTHSMEAAAEFAEKNAAMRAIINNDDFLQAGLKGRGNDARVKEELYSMGYRGSGLDQGVAAIRAARRAAPDEVFEVAAAMALPATGTAFKRRVAKDANGNDRLDAQGNPIMIGGAGEMHSLINEVAGNDRVKAGRMLAAMRSGAGQARRFDLNGGGFGSQVSLLEEQFEAEQALKAGQSAAITIDNVTKQKVNVSSLEEADILATRRIVDESLEGQGGSYVAGARKNAVEAFAPVMLERIEKVGNSGDVRLFRQELAALAGRYDAMQSVSPENARVLANEVLSKSVNGSSKSLQQLIEDNRSDPEFLQMRREYGAASRQGANQAQIAAMAAAQQQGPQQPPIPPPIPPI